MNVTRKSPTAPRFNAEWIEKQHIDPVSGEWIPDKDEYAGSDHRTLDEAKAAAIAGSKKANVVEWVRVTEENFDPDLGIPWSSPAAWDVVRSWSGDWEGNWESVRD